MRLVRRVGVVLVAAWCLALYWFEQQRGVSFVAGDARVSSASSVVVADVGGGSLGGERCAGSRSQYKEEQALRSTFFLGKKETTWRSARSTACVFRIREL